MSEEKPTYDIEKARRDNAILKKYAAIQKASEDKIGCQKIYVDMTNDLEAALVLDEIIFFTLPRANTGKSGLRIFKDGYLWMAVRRSEWWERKRLKEREADLAIDKLEKLSLIVKKVHRFNSLPTVHLRLNIDVFFKLYFEILERDNPPEDEKDSTISDINDLYEMMGIPFSPNGNLPNGDSRLPNGDDSLPNGNSINSPHTALTQPLTADAESQNLQELVDDANKKVDAILRMEREAKEREKAGQAWRGRELLAPAHLSYGDWWHSQTGLHMYGAKSKAKRDTGWEKAFREWEENELTVFTLQEAYNSTVAWKKTVASPNEITGTAKAMQAAKAQEKKYEPVAIDADGFPESY